MRILWFSNTPALASEYLSLNGTKGGWLYALNLHLQEKVELHVAFYYVKSSSSFVYQNTIFHPICPHSYKWQVIKNIIYPRIIDQEDKLLYDEIIKKVKPDLIHIHGTENPFGCIIKDQKIPIVVSIQGIINVISKKFRNDFSKNDLSTSEGGELSLKNIFLKKTFQKIYKDFLKMGFRESNNLLEAKFIIGRTDWDYRVTSILAPNSIYFHNDEILRATFYLHEWNHHDIENITIHTTTGNSPYKGFETICETLILLVRYFKKKVIWQVAGLKETDLIVQIVKRKLKDQYPTEAINLMGNVDEQKLVESMLNSSIYVMPSHIENSSNSLCEAMLVGMPCIATFAGGTGSILKDGEDGILVQDGDPWAMAGAILELIKDKDKASRFGKSARLKAFKRHDSQKIVDQLVLIYKDIINKQIES